MPHEVRLVSCWSFVWKVELSKLHFISETPHCGQKIMGMLQGAVIKPLYELPSFPIVKQSVGTSHVLLTRARYNSQGFMVHIMLKPSHMNIAVAISIEVCANYHEAPPVYTQIMIAPASTVTINHSSKTGLQNVLISATHDTVIFEFGLHYLPGSR